MKIGPARRTSSRVDGPVKKALLVGINYTNAPPHPEYQPLCHARDDTKEFADLLIGMLHSACPVLQPLIHCSEIRVSAGEYRDATGRRGRGHPLRAHKGQHCRSIPPHVLIVPDGPCLCSFARYASWCTVPDQAIALCSIVCLLLSA